MARLLYTAPRTSSTFSLAPALSVSSSVREATIPSLRDPQDYRQMEEPCFYTFRYYRRRNQSSRLLDWNVPLLRNALRPNWSWQRQDHLRPLQARWPVAGTLKCWVWRDRCRNSCSQRQGGGRALRLQGISICENPGYSWRRRQVDLGPEADCRLLEDPWLDLNDIFKLKSPSEIDQPTSHSLSTN